MLEEGKKRIWAEYQKAVPDNNYYFVRSCIRQTFFPGSEQAFIRIIRNELGKDIYETPYHTTCTGIGYHSDIIPFETTMTVVARQFALMTEAGYSNYIPSCITSFGLYTEVLETWHHFPEIEARIRENLWKATKREFKIPDNLSHPSDIFYHFRKNIAEKAKYSLVDIESGQPLNVVEHIGCHYSKMFPGKGIGGAEYPCVLIGMIEAWGGNAIDYPERRHCCGFGFRQYIVQSNRGYSVSCSRKKFESMKPYQPDLILTNCPGCPMFLDRWQYVISEIEGKTYGKNNQGIPVFTYEELAGLILGYDPWELGLQLHQIDCEPLLKKMGIKYNPSEKYLGYNREYIGKPEITKNLFHCC